MAAAQTGYCALMFLGIVISIGDDVPEAEFNLPSRLPRALNRRARHLRFLNFGNSRIGPTQVEPTATFLSEFVPQLTTLTAWSDNLTDHFQDPVAPPSLSVMPWNQVADMYGQLTLHEQSPDDWYSWKGFNKANNF
ncbi:hypothetical protein B0H19DRAFT_1250178 [Mycena capillaripes]|nr:hypothetical protein B0H19DRAFT_1250178 [Mycena capillaripes]